MVSESNEYINWRTVSSEIHASHTGGSFDVYSYFVYTLNRNEVRDQGMLP